MTNLRTDSLGNEIMEYYSMISVRLPHHAEESGFTLIIILTLHWELGRIHRFSAS